MVSDWRMVSDIGEENCLYIYFFFIRYKPFSLSVFSISIDLRRSSFEIKSCASKMLTVGVALGRGATVNVIDNPLIFFFDLLTLENKSVNFEVRSAN